MLKKLASSISSFFSAQKSPHHSEVLDLPDHILEELRKVPAVLEGAQLDFLNNITGSDINNNFLVKPDAELKAVLRENARVDGYVLRSHLPFNFIPPALYLPADYQPSQALNAYLKAQTLLKFTYSVDSEGYRRTLPESGATRNLLVVGDSVGFGTTVNDHDTIPSFLQKLFGNELRVFNACVGNYDGAQAVLMAERQSEKRTFDQVLYVACQNDFMQRGQSMSAIEKARETLESFKKIADRFPGGVCIYLQSYLEYCMKDLFLTEGWGQQTIRQTDELRTALRKFCEELGFCFGDWFNQVSNYVKSQRSLYSEFALYIDHCHFSPLGNSLAAEAIFSIITQDQSKER